jgi:membrane protease YdiL (CAAX protease family)
LKKIVAGLAFACYHDTSMPILDSPTFWLNLTRLLILVFTGFIAWMTYRSHLLLKDIQPDLNLLLFWPETVARLVLVGICLLLAWLSGLPPAELGLTVGDVQRSVTLGLAIGVITQLAVLVVTMQLVKRFGRQIYSPWLIRSILPRRNREWLLIAFAFLPPVAMEELLFRTLLIGVFRPIVPLWLLIIGTSIIFGLMHLPQGRLGLALTAAINLFFCIVFVWTGELLVTFVAHYVVNMLQIIAAHFQRDWLESL